MIKHTFSALLVSALFGSLGAQTVITDTVSMGAGYANSNYFNVVTGSKHTSPVNKWHMAHTSATRDNCISFKSHRWSKRVFISKRRQLRL